MIFKSDKHYCTWVFQLWNDIREICGDLKNIIFKYQSLFEHPNYFRQMEEQIVKNTSMGGDSTKELSSKLKWYSRRVK